MLNETTKNWIPVSSTGMTPLLLQYSPRP
ncbi:MAG: hypothetical protein LBU56_01305 [Rickettsiales bacterium]|nr:hypothetical protein [Rickettsiales bacterium]